METTGKYYFDYKGQIETMINHIRKMEDHPWKDISRIDDHTYIAEFRTFGIHGPRQTGKTYSISAFVAEHPDECVMVFKDDFIQRNFTALLSIKAGETRQVAHSLLRQSTENSCRLPSFEFLKDVPGRHEKIKYVILDEASTLYSYCGLKRKPFNKYIAELFGPDIIVIEVG